MRLFIPVTSSFILISSQKYEEIDSSRSVYCTPQETPVDSNQCDFRMCGCINDYVPGLQREFDFEKMCDTDMDISHMNCTDRLITLSQQREAVTKELAMDEEAEAAAQEWLEEKLRKKAENRQKRMEAKEAKQAQEFNDEAETWARSLNMQDDAMAVVECTEEESEEECDARQSANELSYADYKKSLDSVKEARKAKQDCTIQENIDHWRQRKAHCCHNGIFRKGDTIWMDFVAGVEKEDENLNQDDFADENPFFEEEGPGAGLLGSDEWARALPVPGMSMSDSPFDELDDDEEDTYINTNPKAGMFAHACVLGRVYSFSPKQEKKCIKKADKFSNKVLKSIGKNGQGEIELIINDNSDANKRFTVNQDGHLVKKALQLRCKNGVFNENKAAVWTWECDGLNVDMNVPNCIPGETAESLEEMDDIIQERILGGTQVTESGKYPWQGLLYMFGGSRSSFCGCVVVSENVILTAAHCIKQGDLSGLGVRNAYALLGTNDRDNQNKKAQKRYLRKCAMHEGFTSYGPIMINDIAYCALDHPIDFNDKNSVVAPACLPTSSSYNENSIECYATGFGTTSK